MMANICVINDDLAFCTVLADLLSDRGQDTVTCCDSSDAYEHLKRDGTDLVIVDLMTRKPEGGWDLLTYLNMHPRLRSLPAVVCSAVTDELLSKEEWLRDHGVRIVEKPFDLEDLYMEVDAALGRGVSTAR